MTVKINPFTGGMQISGLTRGIALAAKTDSGMTASATEIVCPGLSGYGDDYFNNHFYMQILAARHELLTIDGAPAPGDFAPGATLTGATSGETCEVVACLTSTTYLVKDRSGDFDDGEIIEDGTNSINCGAGFPTFTPGQAPEHEVRLITDYVGASGTFETDPFTITVEPDSEIMVLHESLVSLGRNDADNAFDSSDVTKNRDGSILERTEFIIDALMGTQFRTEQSHAASVEENGFQMFSVSLFDLDSGAILSADIGIGAISQVMEKSSGGADFSSAGITQPTFAKADGRVYCSYQFVSAQWQVGDLYRLTVSGITAVVDGETVYCPAMVWSNAVLEVGNIDTNVKTIMSELSGAAGVATFPPAADPGDGVSLAEVIRAIVTSLTGGDDYDGYTNINNSANASINAIAQKFAVLLAADGANVFDPAMFGGAQATIEAAFAAIGSALGVEYDGTPSLYATVKAVQTVPVDGTTPPVANTLSDILHKDGSFTFDNTTDSLEALSDAISEGSLQIEADAGSTASAIIDAAALTQATNDWWKGALLLSINGNNSGQARPIVGFDAATDTIAVSPPFLAAPTAGDDFLVISGWKMPEWAPMPAVAVNVTAVVSPGVDVIDLKDADLKETYRLNNVRFKFADPGANTITITLSELINDVAVAVDTFVVTTDNFGDYHSLMDMFGIPHITGDAILINAMTSAGSYALTGQYQYDISYNA